MTVQKIIREAKPGITSDGDNLHLQITKTGSASWIFRYKFQSRPARDMGLGGCSKVTLAEARQKAANARKLISSGIDPLEDKKANKARRTQEHLSQQTTKARTIPFRQIAAEYIASHRESWRNAKHAQQWENTLEAYAYPIIGDLPANEIGVDHILKILQPIWTEKPETASRTRGRLELVLDAAKARNLRDGENPARWRGHLDKLLSRRSKAQETKHHSAMPWAELPSFVQLLLNEQGFSARALELAILTGCRSSEVLHAQWSEIDLKNALWIIPAQRMKAGREHRVPLSNQVIALLQNLPRVGTSLYLFPGRVEGKPLSNMAMTSLIRRMNFGHFTVHGFRSTFRDWAAESTHYPREVCEMALAHAVAKGAEAAYWRADLLDKRRELMQDWGIYATGAAFND